MRQKTNVTAPTESEAQECMMEYTKSNSELKKIEAQMELSIQKVREKFTNDVERLSKSKTESYQKLQAFATTNRDKLFSKKKSLDWIHGVLGFRTGTPKVSKKTGITWQAMLDLLKGQSKDEFIRTKEEIDKDKILSSREDKEVMEELENLGIKVVQDETFFVEPKEEVLAEV